MLVIFLVIIFCHNFYFTYFPSNLPQLESSKQVLPYIYIVYKWADTNKSSVKNLARQCFLNS